VDGWMDGWMDRSSTCWLLGHYWVNINCDLSLIWEVSPSHHVYLCSLADSCQDGVSRPVNPTTRPDQTESVKVHPLACAP
jgi:hypothetical protein